MLPDWKVDIGLKFGSISISCMICTKYKLIFNICYFGSVEGKLYSKMVRECNLIPGVKKYWFCFFLGQQHNELYSLVERL